MPLTLATAAAECAMGLALDAASATGGQRARDRMALALQNCLESLYAERQSGGPDHVN